MVNPALRDYRIPAFADVPRSELYFADTYDRSGRWARRPRASARSMPSPPRLPMRWRTRRACASPISRLRRTAFSTSSALGMTAPRATAKDRGEAGQTARPFGLLPSCFNRSSDIALHPGPGCCFLAAAGPLHTRVAHPRNARVCPPVPPEGAASHCRREVGTGPRAHISATRNAKTEYPFTRLFQNFRVFCQ